MKNRFFHYSWRPIAHLMDTEQQVEPAFKPTGLWYAEGRSWKKASQHWRDMGYFDHRYEVTIAPGANVLRLETTEDMEAFSDRFGKVLGDGCTYRIRWPEVSAIYDGIHLGLVVHTSTAYDHSKLWWAAAWEVVGGCIWKFSDGIAVVDNMTGRAIDRTDEVRSLRQVPPYVVVKREALFEPAFVVNTEGLDAQGTTP